jgi:hypothetical protein
VALVVTWIGAGLTLPYYGAETYGLGVVIFGTGLALLAAGGAIAAAAAWRSGGLTRWGGALLGAGLVLFIPQFWGPQPVRIAHGVLMAAGCLLLAAGLWRRGTAGPAAGSAAGGPSPAGHGS